MTRFVILICALMTCGGAFAGGAEGLWRTEAEAEGYLEVRIGPCGTALCGWIEQARRPDGTAGPYPHIGRQMIRDMAPDGPGRWEGGKIWDPRRDRDFSSRMQLSGDVLTVSGCLLGLCERQIWQRVK